MFEFESLFMLHIASVCSTLLSWRVWDASIVLHFVVSIYSNSVVLIMLTDPHSNFHFYVWLAPCMFSIMQCWTSCILLVLFVCLLRCLAVPLWYLGRVFWISMGIKLPPLHVSILYSILHLLHSVIVYNLVIIADLILLNPRDMIVSESRLLSSSGFIFNHSCCLLLCFYCFYLFLWHSASDHFGTHFLNCHFFCIHCMFCYMLGIASACVFTQVPVHFEPLLKIYFHVWHSDFVDFVPIFWSTVSILCFLLDFLKSWLWYLSPKSHCPHWLLFPGDLICIFN